MTFDELGLHPDLLKAVHDLGYARPTPIQEQVIGPVLSGKDLTGCAQTGTGKTAGFGLPILHRLHTRPPAGPAKIRALILTPTRELAAQVGADLKDLAKYTKVRAAVVFGGVGMQPQEQALRSGTEIIVATPGRLLDHMNRGYVSFHHLEVLVLDEADRMLDMGFLPDLRRIVSKLPSHRQTLMFSATIPPEIQTLANQLLKNPIRISVETKSRPAVGITHAVYPVSQGLKTMLLLRIMKESHAAMGSVLIFMKMKHHADRLKDRLAREGYRVGVLHSNRSQSQRTRALDEFRDGQVQILVATDIAARGLDIEGISHVINYDVPNTKEDYIHRVGRTARVEALGDAFTLMAPDEERVIRAVEYDLGKPIPRVMLPDFPYHVIAHAGVIGGGPPRRGLDSHRGRRPHPSGGRGGRPHHR